ncbi:WhiB family transcriptional regulator [Streptomyces fagopyri]|uniref:WhiB family transcriptional regulator n=1 Tax=Streptomyces fagopyri TaxID=2662397 RepID=UPI0036CE3356
MGDLSGLIRPEAWEADAACAKAGIGVEPDDFFSNVTTKMEAAARFCVAFCTVREQCLEQRLAAEVAGERRIGVAGGFTAKRRKKLVDERRAAAAGAGATS